MSFEIRMPQISTDMTEADLVGWLAGPGDSITEGELLYEIETEKSTVEIEAPASGVLREILVPAGSSGVAVGTVLAMLDTDASEARVDPPSAPTDAAPPPAVRTRSPQATPAPSADRSAATIDPPATKGDRAPDHSVDVPATALARRVAERAGLDLSRVAGSGSRGRITRDDVEQQIAGVTALDVPDGRLPRPPAATSSSVHTTAPAGSAAGVGPGSTEHATTLATRCRVDTALAVLDRLNPKDPGDRSIRLIDLVVRAAALALREIPEANTTWNGAEPIQRERVDIEISLGADRTSVLYRVRDAAHQGLAALAAERRRRPNGQTDPNPAAAAEASEAGLRIEDVGAFGLTGVSPAAPKSHSYALGVGAAVTEPVVEDGRLLAGKVLTLSLAPNPRIDGVIIGARLLAAIARRLERPLEMIV